MPCVVCGAELEKLLSSMFTIGTPPLWCPECGLAYMSVPKVTYPLARDPVFFKECNWVDMTGTNREEGWYFWDELGADAHGAYPDEETCRAQLKEYAESL